MVTFTNITFDDEWIYADAYDHDYKGSGKIKVHRVKELFETDCINNISRNQFQKASWAIVRYVNKGKIKQGGAKSIAWG